MTKDETIAALRKDFEGFITKMDDLPKEEKVKMAKKIIAMMDQWIAESETKIKERSVI